MSKTNPTLLEVLIKRVGLRRAVTLGTFCIKWGYWLDSEPAEPDDMEAFAEFALLSRSQAFKLRQWWREALPEYPDPSVVWNNARAGVERNARPELASVQLLTVALP